MTAKHTDGIHPVNTTLLIAVAALVLAVITLAIVL